MIGFLIRFSLMHQLMSFHIESFSSYNRLMRDLFQIFVRCGGVDGTLAFACSPTTRVTDLKVSLSHRLCCHMEGMRLTYGGYEMQDEHSIETSIRSKSSDACMAEATVHLTGRLRGGGGDGGSTGAESRSCYLEMYAGKKTQKVDPAEELVAKWTRCHLSGEPLSPPVVIDELGNMYNKDVIVHALLHKAMPSALSFISSLKHVTEVKLEKAAHSSAGPSVIATKGGLAAGNESAFCCPIAGVSFNGRFKFVVFKSGLVVSEKALKDAPTVVSELLGTTKWTSDDFIPVNPSGEEQISALKEKVLVRMNTEREKRKMKKEVKNLVANDGISKVAEATGMEEEEGVLAGLEAAPGSLKRVADFDLANEMKKAMKPAPVLTTMPKNGSSKVYASLFQSSVKSEAKETYACRSTSARGVHMT